MHKFKKGDIVQHYNPYSNKKIILLIVKCAYEDEYYNCFILRDEFSDNQNLAEHAVFYLSEYNYEIISK